MVANCNAATPSTFDGAEGVRDSTGEPDAMCKLLEGSSTSGVAPGGRRCKIVLESNHRATAIRVRPLGATDWRRDYATAFPTAEAWARSPVPDLTNCLNRLAIPVLLIWATHDPLSPLHVAHTLAAKIPSASIIT